ncbi:unnamed protein product [Linum trigynum]|uniref:Uncharacterized protein n=1 Tax=Linum trigynum TaxID=586398 RepID=A0AAV2FSB9_9ROSI
MQQNNESPNLHGKLLQNLYSYSLIKRVLGWRALFERRRPSPSSSSYRGPSATKKPFQIITANKKTSPKKLLEGSYPITLKAIEEFYAHTQLKALEFQKIFPGKPSDVDMEEIQVAAATNVQLEIDGNQGGPPAAPVAIT